jgi:hypothetical protein
MKAKGGETPIIATISLSWYPSQLRHLWIRSALAVAIPDVLQDLQGGWWTHRNFLVVLKQRSFSLLRNSAVHTPHQFSISFLGELVQWPQGTIVSSLSTVFSHKKTWKQMTVRKMSACLPRSHDPRDYPFNCFHGSCVSFSPVCTLPRYITLYVTHITKALVGALLCCVFFVNNFRQWAGSSNYLWRS